MLHLISILSLTTLCLGASVHLSEDFGSLKDNCHKNDIECPTFKYIKWASEYTIREYNNLVFAETNVVGEQEELYQAAIDKLNNYFQAGNDQKLTMTENFPIHVEYHSLTNMTMGIYIKQAFRQNSVPVPNDPSVIIKTIDFCTVAVKKIHSETDFFYSLQNVKQELKNNVARDEILLDYNKPSGVSVFLYNNASDKSHLYSEVWVDVDISDGIKKMTYDEKVQRLYA
eukprot:Awhi_evm1s10921